MSYNGYPNWETWNVSLWFNSDEALYRGYREAARQTPFTAETAERFTRSLMPAGMPDFDSAEDYDEVDWQKIADVFNEE